MTSHKKNGVFLKRGALLLFLMGASLSHAADFRDRAVSSSRQFVVYAKEPSRQAELLLGAEEMRGAWLKLSETDEGQTRPIVIQLIPRSKVALRSPPVSLRLLEGDGGLVKVQLDIREDADIDLGQEMLRAILLEQIYRKAKNVAGKAFQYPPAWLIEGALGMMEAWVTEPPSSLFLRLVEKNDIPHLDAFLEIDPERLDATSRAVYRAQAMALLRAILDQSNGSRELRDYLASLEKKEDGTKLFLSSFRSLGGSPEKVRRHWTLMVARYSAAVRIKPLSSSETGERLEKLLSIELPEVAGKKAAEKPEGSAVLVTLARDKANRPILKTLYLELARLGLRSHPLWKAMVDEYAANCDRLSKGKLGGAEKRLKDLDELRAKLRERARKIESYLDWYEATKLSVPSGEFADTLRDAAGDPPPRTDPISLHMDSVEEHGWR